MVVQAVPLSVRRARAPPARRSRGLCEKVLADDAPDFLELGASFWGPATCLDTVALLEYLRARRIKDHYLKMFFEVRELVRAATKEQRLDASDAEKKHTVWRRGAPSEAWRGTRAAS